MRPRSFVRPEAALLRLLFHFSALRFSSPRLLVPGKRRNPFSPPRLPIGFNASDFTISADTCSSSIAANASCTISIAFSPLAAGTRTTTLTITDNEVNSPQFITLIGTALPAVTIAAPTGESTAATLTAGQTAHFKLQVTPGAGFNGIRSR